MFLVVDRVAASNQAIIPKLKKNLSQQAKTKYTNPKEKKKVKIMI